MAVGLHSVGSFTTSFTRHFGMPPTAYRATFPPAAARGRASDLRRARSMAAPRHARFEKTPRQPALAFEHQRDRRPDHRRTPMIRIATAQLWVHDQDEALEFCTEKLGFEVRSDVTLPEMGNFRWLTVGPAGQPDVAIVLMAIPGPPVIDDADRRQIRDLMGKGFAGTVFLTTDDCQKAYDEMKARGVEFIEKPEEQPYGIDAGFRDPSGNNLRLAQLHGRLRSTPDRQQAHGGRRAWRSAASAVDPPVPFRSFQPRSDSGEGDRAGRASPPGQPRPTGRELDPVHVGALERGVRQRDPAAAANPGRRPGRPQRGAAVRVEDLGHASRRGRPAPAWPARRPSRSNRPWPTAPATDPPPTWTFDGYTMRRMISCRIPSELYVAVEPVAS